MSELPVYSTLITISVEVSYKTLDGTHKVSQSRFFPSKAEATFKRNMATLESVIKSTSKTADQAATSIKGLEERLHKRLRKLEKRNDSDATGATDPQPSA